MMSNAFRDRLGRLLSWRHQDDQDGAALTMVDDIVGTKHDDYLVGTGGSDRIDGRKGADTMAGAGGNDVYIVDNVGDQVVELDGEGLDTVKSRVSYTLGVAIENLTLNGKANIDGTGNSGANKLTGNSGNNRLDGAGGNDVISAHRGADSLLGGDGDDSLDGGQDNDQLDGGAGADTLLGGFGDDSYTVTDALDTIFELDDAGHDTVRAAVSLTLAANVEELILTGAANLDGTGNALDNRISGNKGANVLSGAEGADVLIGHKGNDTLLGGAGTDYLDGSADADWLDGGLGADQLLGGTGNDTFVIDDLGDAVMEFADGGIDLVKSTITYTLGAHQENLTLVFGEYPSNINGYGNDLANLITDNAGRNVIDGGAGDDTIVGGQHISPYESDTLIGGAGNDQISGGSFMYSDMLYGGTGNDTLSASGSGELHGEEGDDVLIGGGAFAPHGGGNGLYGGDGNDNLTAGLAHYGGAGNDVLNTSFNAVADGGDGNDTIKGAGGSGYWDFSVNGGAGVDFIDVFSARNLDVNGGDDADNIWAEAALLLSVDGGAGDDVVVATISFEDGQVRGGDGNDHLTVYSRAGADSLTVDGGAGDDWISTSTRPASAGGSVFGGDGNDTIEAAGGGQEVTGGQGLDTYILAPALEWYFADSLTDFNSADDTLAVQQEFVPIGNGDLVVDNATTTTGPGGFDADAELVLLAQDIVGPLSLDAIAQAFGAADTAYSEGQTAMFVASDGSTSWVCQFKSSGNDATITADELTLMCTMSAGAKPAIDDIIFVD